ncbi:DUF1707 SHOCT-like domain-containing protein [Phytomonospora endophytica]|uniref:DUF1707 domain-containing protein n=1 Tax=Phytomonospora endophytica TaxID=714109 RepID=A0A841FS45_9ACTN|nr:DUF1707 domain-containing protein [Phytomonospora endophytica]MBB6037633.1 hypothetical protein [Phytomonospora endophytica]GIG67840.1 hypothetical protein Pen01_41350 [Phytomonospora endophytica]
MPDAPSRIGDPERDHARLVLDEAHRRGYIDDNEYILRRGLLDVAVWDVDLADIVGDLWRVHELLAPAPMVYVAPPQVIDHRLRVSGQRPVSHKIMDGVGAIRALIGLTFLGMLIWLCVAAINDF